MVNVIVRWSALALAVVLWHSYALINGNAVAAQSRHGLVAVLTYALVPAFFALSGFLVAGSMLRLRNLKTFLAFRALRILPPVRRNHPVGARARPVGDDLASWAILFESGILRIFYQHRRLDKISSAQRVC